LPGCGGGLKTSDDKHRKAAVTPADIDAAAKVIAPYAVRTPLLWSPVLNERVGARISSNRNLAADRLVQVPRRFQQAFLHSKGQRAGGVVAFSSGKSRAGRGGGGANS